MVRFPLHEPQRARVLVIGLRAPRRVDRIAQALRHQRQHRSVVRGGIDLIAGGDEDAATGAHPLRDHVDALGGQRGDIGEHDDVEVLELDRARGALGLGIDARQLLRGDRTHLRAGVLAIARAQCSLDVEQLVVVPHRARITVDQQHADLVAQRGANPAAIIDRQRIAGDRHAGIGRARTGGQRCKEPLAAALVGGEIELTTRDHAIRDRERHLELRRRIGEVRDLRIERDAA